MVAARGHHGGFVVAFRLRWQVVQHQITEVRSVCIALIHGYSHRPTLDETPPNPDPGL